MSKKTKTSKKHRFKHTAPAGEAEATVSTSAPVAAASERRLSMSQPMVAVGRDFSYVQGDLRRVGLLAGSLVTLELLLWWVLGHTGVGSAVYNLLPV